MLLRSGWKWPRADREITFRNAAARRHAAMPWRPRGRLSALPGRARDRVLPRPLRLGPPDHPRRVPRTGRPFLRARTRRD